MSSFVAFFVMGLVTVLVTLTDETIEKEKKNEFGVDFVEGLLISEAMAWATGERAHSALRVEGSSFAAIQAAARVERTAAGLA